MHSISNLKLPDLENHEKNFKPSRKGKPVENSKALEFNSLMALNERYEAKYAHDEGDLDAIIKHI